MGNQMYAPKCPTVRGQQLRIILGFRHSVRSGVKSDHLSNFRFESASLQRADMVRRG
jgi:hypothetical protein